MNQQRRTSKPTVSYVTKEAVDEIDKRLKQLDEENSLLRTYVIDSFEYLRQQSQDYTNQLIERLAYLHTIPEQAGQNINGEPDIDTIINRQNDIKDEYIQSSSLCPDYNGTGGKLKKRVSKTKKISKK